MSNAKKIELKVNINCNKCKTNHLKAATKLTGIDQISVDSQKGTLTVIGDIDPVLLTVKLRKSVKFAEIISVGPPKKPDPPKPDPKPLPPCCKECQLVAISYVPDTSYCSIL